MTPRYPSFPVRLRPDDRQTIADIQEKFELRTLAEAIRVSSRVLLLLDLSPEEVRSLNEQYETAHPDAWKIKIGDSTG